MKRFAVLFTILFFGFTIAKADDCVRAVPEPIIKKTVFPKTAFKLENNKDYPAEQIGTETVKFNNGDSLVIKNRGCENYTLIFKFTTSRFSANPQNSKFWFAKAIELVEQTKKGIRKEDIRLISDGVATLRKYLKKHKNPKYDEYIKISGDEIEELVAVNKIKKLTGAKYEIEVTFTIGPL